MTPFLQLLALQFQTETSQSKPSLLGRKLPSDPEWTFGYTTDNNITTF